MTGTSSRAQAAKRPSLPRSPRIVVVDDDPLIRLWLCQSLFERGYRVFDAEDEDAVLATLVDGHSLPEIVLLDHPLSDARDFGLLRRLVKRSSRMRVIVMSTESAATVSEEALKSGAFAVINKPFEIKDLLALLDRQAPPSAAD